MKSCPFSRPAESVCLQRRRDDRAIGRSGPCSRCGVILSEKVIKEAKKIPRGEINTKAIRNTVPQFPAVADQEVRSKGRGGRSRNGAGGAPHNDRGKGGNGDRPTPTKQPHSVRYMSFAGSPAPKVEKAVAVAKDEKIVVIDRKAQMAHARQSRWPGYLRPKRRVA